MKKWLILVCFCIGIVASCDESWQENPIENICANQDLALSLKCLSALPKEDIMSIPEVREYLDKHKVYISFTSSPSRLKNAIWMLKTLDLEYVEKVYLTLPQKYQNKEDYPPLPSEIANFPKLERIGWDKSDVGPATKVLYALNLVSKMDPDAIVISVDDDTGLPAGAIGQLIKYAVLNPNAVVGGSGRYASLFGVNYVEWPNDPMTTLSPYCGRGEISFCNILEGFKGIAYKPRLVNVDKIMSLVATSKSCLASDDFVISYALALDKIDRIRISNDYFRRVNQFSFGFGEDALNRLPSKKKEFQDGWQPRFSWSGAVGVKETSERYQRCAYELSTSQPTSK